jgi:hypothetical protein
MYPTDDAVKRAELCLSCHLGNDQQSVDHRMMAAGHPRLSFELETFGQIEPAHYRVDDDYRARKGASVLPPAKTWAIGQLVTARAYLAALASPARSHSGAWPEFTLYDCYSCHQVMRTTAAKDRALASAPALPALGTTSLTLVAGLLPVVDAPAAAPFDQAVVQLQQAVRGLDYQKPIAELERGLAAALVATGRWTSPPEDVPRLLQGIAGTAAERGERPLTYTQAEQLTMAAQALAATLPGPRGKGDRVAAGVDRLFVLTRSDATFDPDKFRDALRALAAAAGG